MHSLHQQTFLRHGAWQTELSYCGYFPHYRSEKVVFNKFIEVSSFYRTFMFFFKKIREIHLEVLNECVKARMKKYAWKSRQMRETWQVCKAFSRRLQDVFKTSSRPLAKTSSRRLQKHLLGIFKTSCKDAFKLFSIIRLNCLPSSRIWLGHTSEKFMISVENLQMRYILA